MKTHIGLERKVPRKMHNHCAKRTTNRVVVTIEEFIQNMNFTHEYAKKQVPICFEDLCTGFPHANSTWILTEKKK